MKNLAPFLLVFLWTFYACSKVVLPNGSYLGRFTVEYGSVLNEGPFQLSITDNAYQCSGNSNRIPAGGSGVFTLENNSIKFQDMGMWTADFDWNLILNGEYKYRMEGDTLVLAKEMEQAKYTYRIGIRR